MGAAHHPRLPRSGLSGLCSPWQPLLSHPWPSQCLEEDGMRCWCCPPRGSSVCRLSSVRLPRTPRGRSPCSPSGRAGTQTCLQTRVWSAAQGNQSWGRGAAWLGSGAFMEFERVEDRGGFPGNSWSCRPLLGAQCWQEGAAGQGCPSVFGCVQWFCFDGHSLYSCSWEPVFWIKYSKNKCINHS